jgi:uncharacterized protein (TIGR02449 family)
LPHDNKRQRYTKHRAGTCASRGTGRQPAGGIVRLTRENRSLRAQQDSLAIERAGLLEKHDQVRNRVDAIVTRLKSLESGA